MYSFSKNLLKNIVQPTFLSIVIFFLFATVAFFIAPYVLAAASLPFSDNFESGNLTVWEQNGELQTDNSANNIVKADATSKYQGNYGLHIKNSPPNDDARANIEIASTGQLYTRMAMKLVGTNTNTGPFFILGASVNGGNIGGLSLQTNDSGQNTIFTEAGTSLVDSGFVLSPNIWHCVETHVVASPDAGRVRLWVDGILITDRLNLGTGVSPISWIRLGTDGGGTAAEMYFDDFQTSTTGQIGCGGFNPPTTPDTTPPILFRAEPSNNVIGSSTTLTLQTDEVATCKYDPSATTYATMANTFATTGGTSHATPITGLVEGSSYTYHVSCKDAAGNINAGDFTISFNVEKPQVVPGVLSLIPTYESIGVYANFSGDTNKNHTALLEWRKKGDPTWKKGMALTVDRRLAIEGERGSYDNPYYNQWRGSVLGVKSGTAYEVRVTFSDPEGVNGTSQVIGTVTTWPDSPPPITGAKYYVATTGSDTNPGTLASPFKTIQKAIDVANPGDGIYVRSGTYHEVAYFSNKAGNATNYYTLSTYNNESVIIDAEKKRANYIVVGQGSQFIYIHGFEMVNNMDDQTQDQEVGGTGGIRIVNGANRIIIDSVNLHDFNDNAVRLDWDAQQVTLQNSTFHRNILTAHDNDEGHIISVWRSDHGNDVFRNNTFKDTTGILRDQAHYFDCVAGGSNFEINGFVKADSDIYNNYFEGCSDDHLEAEGGDINIRIWNNMFNAGPNGFIGFASAPVMVGPLYFFKNTIHGERHSAAIKEGRTSYGNKYYYNNTIFMQVNPADATTPNDVFEQTNAGLYNITSRNNVLHSNRYVVEYTTVGSGQTMNFDYDLLYTSDPTRFIKWPDTCSCTSLAGFQSIGQETHGFNFDDTNEYVDPVNGNYNLKPGSRLIDKGQVLVGFNDPDSAWPYVGSAPDIGANEFGVSPTPSIALGNGDADGNGTVNINDIKVLLQNWLANLTGIIDQYGDGRINALDFARVANNL